VTPEEESSRLVLSCNCHQNSPPEGACIVHCSVKTSVERSKLSHSMGCVSYNGDCHYYVILRSLNELDRYSVSGCCGRFEPIIHQSSGLDNGFSNDSGLVLQLRIDRFVSSIMLFRSNNGKKTWTNFYGLTKSSHGILYNTSRTRVY
jgi:hypothetical protein